MIMGKNIYTLKENKCMIKNCGRNTPKREVSVESFIEI